MEAASELRAILSVADRLATELGAEATAGAATSPDQDHPGSWGWIDKESAQLVARLRSALARIAAAAADREAGDADRESSERAAAALARTELVIRGELSRGKQATLREQLPGFVFLVVLPGAGMDRALELSNRTKALLDEAPL